MEKTFSRNCSSRWGAWRVRVLCAVRAPGSSSRADLIPDALALRRALWHGSACPEEEKETARIVRAFSVHQLSGFLRDDRSRNGETFLQAPSRQAVDPQGRKRRTRNMMQ